MTSVERAARALAEALQAQEPQHGGTFHVDSDDLRATVIDGTFDLYALARAVIAAIREPSEGMVEAAVLSTVDVWGDERDAGREFKIEFSAAIDALLEEGK
jgi:hypothetical protein